MKETIRNRSDRSETMFLLGSNRESLDIGNVGPLGGGRRRDRAADA